tara:strand:+ start:48 stop:320 length:273 start_codon:yes stop_codon:yes gene_type:complete
MNERIIAFFSLSGLWAYATVLLYCSVTNPPNDKLTLALRIITGSLAVFLGYAFYLSPELNTAPTLTNYLLITFRFLIAFSAYQALRKKTS